VVVLGSATPSLESYHNATIGKYQLLMLTQRVDEKQMPLIHCRSAPGTAEGKEGRHSVKKKVVANDLRSFGEARATILFLNRRGFSTSLLCGECGEGTKLSELQCRAHLSPASLGRRAIELSFVRHTAAVPKKCPAAARMR